MFIFLYVLYRDNSEKRTPQGLEQNTDTILDG